MRVRTVLSIVLGLGLIIEIMILSLDNPARAHTLIVAANYATKLPGDWMTRPGIKLRLSNFLWKEENRSLEQTAQ